MMKSFLLQTFVTILFSSGVVTGFQWPSNFADIAIHSNITATETCNGNVQCNSTCPTRTDFPEQGIQPLTNPSSNCTKLTPDSGIPSEVNKTNGGLEFNSDSIPCNSVNKTYSDVELFTISMWISVNCSNCDVLNSNTRIQLQMVNGRLRLNNASQPIDKTSWHFVVLRYDTSLTWYVDNQRMGLVTPSPTLSSHISVLLGPNANLTDQEYVKIADVRFYKDALTDREIVSLYTDKFQSLPMESRCRCPSTHPFLVNDTIPKQNMKCTNGMEKVSRFNVDAKFSEFLNDNDTSTSWHSGNVETVSVTMLLPRSFQLHKLTMEGVTREPAELKIVTYKDNKQMNVNTFSQDCQSDSACKAYSTYRSTHMFSYEFDGFLNETSSVTREKYETVVADKIVMVIKTDGLFTSSEIRLIARCNCYGNDGTCTVSGDKYSCKCAHNSNTKGDNCQNCSGSHYRTQTNLNCNIPCACDITGSKNTMCEELSGQCDCKTNVIERKCDSCKHNTADLSDSGCTNCTCNSSGITSCSDGPVCNCKEHVETDSDRCMECLPDFYNITQSVGCLPCDCNRVGTDVNSLHTCDKSSGQCHCKIHVEGRRCDKCKAESYDLSASHAITGCARCDCNFVGSIDDNCDQVTGDCNCKMKRIPESQRNCQPTHLNLDPKYGPMAGSTLLTISGQDLGKDVDLSFNIAGIPQTVTMSNDTHIIITTKSTSSEGQKDIILYWVHKNQPNYIADFNQQVKFEYRKDPVIEAASKTPRKSYASGGCTLRFQGISLNSVAYSKLRIYHSSVSMESPCTGDSRLLSCLTPNLTQYGPNTTVTYGFYLDGVTMYRDVSTIEIVDDPNIETGKEEDFKHSFDDVFKIMGSNLNRACHDEDVAILLDGENCKLLSRTNNFISCDPNEKFPGKSRNVEVKVKIGNWMMVWGHLNMKSFWNTNEFIYIAVGVCILGVLIIVAMVCFIRRCRRQKTQQSDFHELEEIKGKRTRNPYEQNPVAIVTPLEGQRPRQNKQRSSTAIVGDFCDRLNSTSSKIVKASLVDRSHIEIGKICTNKGSLTRVVNGTYNVTSSSPDSGSNLTIKTLVDTYPEEGPLPDWLNAGLAECTRLQDFSHENVLRMMGITVDVKNVYILYPEMSNRTLKDYLSSGVEPLADGLKMNICLQIAMGMNYLSADGITHKDLAARNCWVTADEVIKVGDASFAFDLYPEEYLNNGGRYQPVRWMAPECLNQGFYDTKSDVWSFGVIVWEVYTNGYLPYHDIKSNKVVKEKVCRDHYRLGKPHNCSDQMFSVIEECHLDDVDNRPNFFLVVNTIESVINPDPAGPVSYVNDPTEDAIYTNLTDPPPIPPKGRMK